jgi:hypothetical protein
MRWETHERRAARSRTIRRLGAQASRAVSTKTSCVRLHGNIGLFPGLRLPQRGSPKNSERHPDPCTRYLCIFMLRSAISSSFNWATARLRFAFSFSNVRRSHSEARLSAIRVVRVLLSDAQLTRVLGTPFLRFALFFPLFVRPSSMACRLGTYRNAEIAFITAILALADVRASPLRTRETVAVETPAFLAMSFTVDPLIFSLHPRDEVASIHSCFYSRLRSLASDYLDFCSLQ